MNNDRAVIIANHTSEGISLIDVQVYNGNGVLYAQASKDQIDDINKIPYLDRERLKDEVSKIFGVPLNSVTLRLP